MRVMKYEWSLFLSSFEVLSDFDVVGSDSLDSCTVVLLGHSRFGCSFCLRNNSTSREFTDSLKSFKLNNSGINISLASFSFFHFNNLSFQCLKSFNISFGGFRVHDRTSRSSTLLLFLFGGSSLNWLRFFLSRSLDKTIGFDSILSHLYITESTLEGFHLGHFLKPSDKVLDSFLESCIKEGLESRWEHTS